MLLIYVQTLVSCMTKWVEPNVQIISKSSAASIIPNLNQFRPTILLLDNQLNIIPRLYFTLNHHIHAFLKIDILTIFGYHHSYI